MDVLKIALAQITSVDDISYNTQMILSLLNKLAPEQVRVVFFPENCLYMRLKEGEKIKGIDLQHESIQKLSRWSLKNKTSLHLGSIPVKEGADLFNGTVWISDQGEAQISYRKVHLFDIHLENQKPIRESDVFRHGTEPRILEIDGWRLGQSICYDLRFSDLFHYYARQQVDGILIPSAFLVKTGQAHWDILMRARAIESQCYVIASAQAGLHKSVNGQRETYGHSVVVDPWGQVEVELLNSPEIRVVELQRSRLHAVRTQIPMKNHRRGPFSSQK